MHKLRPNANDLEPSAKLALEATTKGNSAVWFKVLLLLWLNLYTWICLLPAYQLGNISDLAVFFLIIPAFMFGLVGLVRGSIGWRRWLLLAAAPLSLAVCPVVLGTQESISSSPLHLLVSMISLTCYFCAGLKWLSLLESQRYFAEVSRSGAHVWGGLIGWVSVGLISIAVLPFIAKGPLGRLLASASAATLLITCTLVWWLPVVRKEPLTAYRGNKSIRVTLLIALALLGAGVLYLYRA